MVPKAAERASEYQTEVIGFILDSKGITKNLYFCEIEVKENDLEFK